MSAFDEIVRKPKIERTRLEKCIINAINAAEELSAMQARIERQEVALNRIVEMCTYEGEIINVCSCGRPNGIPAVVHCAKEALS